MGENEIASRACHTNSPAASEDQVILFVDPGRVAGWAVFDERGRLYWIGITRKPEKLPTGPHYTRLVIEKPHGGRGKASRIDLVALARRMQTIIMSVSANCVEEVPPAKWKGTTAKEIMTRRIRERWMDEADAAVFAAAKLPPSLTHNAIDAYGLGRWWFAKEGIREAPR